MTGALLLNLLSVIIPSKVISLRQPSEWQMPTLTYEDPTLEPWPEEHPIIDMSVPFRIKRKKAGRPAGRPLWIHHHIWKCGGTDLCASAIANSEVIPNHTSNPPDQCDVWESLSFYNELTFATFQQPLGDAIVKVVGYLQDQNAKISVMLRDPLNQTVSHYRHATNIANLSHLSLTEWMQLGICRQRRGQPGHPGCMNKLKIRMSNRGLAEDVIEATMSKIMTHPNKYFFYFQDNIQTRWLSGTVEGTSFGGSTSSDLMGEQQLRSAMQNLAKYTHVFVLERFEDRDRARLEVERNWTDTAHHHAGTGFSSRVEEEVSIVEIEFMRSILRHDLELYDLAKKLASEQATR